MAMIQTIERQKPSVKEETMPLRAAVYARHSSTKQNARSCDEQIMRIRHLVSKGDIHSRKFFGRAVEVDERWIVKDEAISGRTADRAGYQIIIDSISCRTKPFDLLLLDDLSRATRDLGNMLDLYQLAKSRGIEIVSVSDNLSSEDPNSRIFFTVRGMVADFGNEAHSLRTLRGMEAKILKGLSCGDVPFGYKSVATRFEREGSHETPRDFKITLDPEKASVVRKIFKLFVEGYGRSAICKILNEEKIPWPGFYGNIKMGKGWTTSTIFKILNNQKYIGLWTWKKNAYILDPTTGKKIKQLRPEREWVSHHDGQDCKEDLRIVPQTLWNRAQGTFTKIHENDQHGIWGRFFPDVAKYMLSGIIKCTDCGSSMVLICGRRGGYYSCLAAHRQGTCTNKRLIRRTKLEKAVIDHIMGILNDESTFEAAAKRYNELMRAKVSSGRTDIAAFERELAVIEIELKNLGQAIMNGGQSTTVLEAINAKEKRQRWLGYQIKQTKALQQEKVFALPSTMKAKFKGLAEALRKKPNEASSALKKLFPDGLKMRWCGDQWQILGVMAMDNKGGTNEMRMEVK